MNNLSASMPAAGGDLTRALNVNQIVTRLTAANTRRADDLKGYTEKRQYSVTYHGFPARLSASMVVEATYKAPETKQFRILSMTGSKLLGDRVLKRLLATEEAAARHPQETALNSANYSFTLLGEEPVEGRPCYLLAVVPKTDSKLLYRGRIWVDADDYAVTKIEASPEQNPSFWIRSTEIHHVYEKTGPFWLPEHNESDTRVRLGGSAVLTIDYGAYQITPAAAR
ncbi:MAG TPA: outer membrane lipoprotein-sorting protein [Acidobacteriaceae bacterium]